MLPQSSPFSMSLYLVGIEKRLFTASVDWGGSPADITASSNLAAEAVARQTLLMSSSLEEEEYDYGIITCPTFISSMFSASLFITHVNLVNLAEQEVNR